MNYITSKVTSLLLKVLLSLSTLGLLLFSLMLYTSLDERFSWYDGEGGQFLYFIFLTPIVFLCLGALNLLIYRKKVYFHRLSILNTFLPVPCLSLPVLIDGSLSDKTILIGQIFCLILLFSTLFIFIYDILNRDFYIENDIGNSK